MGPSVPMNLITSCKKCNNKRGSMDYVDWLLSPYYISNVTKIPVTVITENARAGTDIPYIEKHLLRNVKRSR